MTATDFTFAPGTMPCHKCGAPGIKNYGTQGFCAEHLPQFAKNRMAEPVWAARDQREWPEVIPLGDAEDVPTFPAHALPSFTRDYVLAVADEMQVEVDLPAHMALLALSISCAGKHVVGIKPGWRDQLNLYIVVALPPSAGKSPVLRKMLGVIQDHEYALREAVIERLEHVRQKRRIIEKMMKRAEDKGDLNEAQRYLIDLNDTPEPIQPRFIADDATPEALAQLLHDHDGRMALVSTEGGPFDIMAGRYSDKANLDVYLKAWGGDPVSVDRINRPPIVIKNPTLTVGLTVQPSVIAALAEKGGDFKGRGLLARLMYSMPKDFVGYRDMIRGGNGIDPTIRDAYEARVLELLDTSVPAEPAVVTMEADAAEIFHLWRQGLEVRRRPMGDLRPMAEWSTKAESSVARVAALIAVAEGRHTVTEDDMHQAIEIGCYWLAHAKIAHDLWSTDDRLTNARAIVAWAQERGLTEFSVRDVYRDLHRRFMAADAVVEPLNLLTERGWVVPLFDGPLVVGRRGQESPKFALNPIYPQK